MKVIRPINVTDAILTSSTIAEDDYAEWSDLTTYAQGDFAISTTTHRVYRSLTADNLDNDPDAEQAALADPLVTDPDPINWQVIGATDRWKLFDSKPSQKATEADNITVVLTPAQFVQGFAAFGVSANTITVTMEVDSVEVYNRTVQMQDESGVTNWFEYWTTPISDLSEVVLLDLPQFANAVITVSIDRLGGNVSVGQVILGQVWDFGTTLFDGTQISGLDFSVVQNDEFGNLTTVQREATRLATFDVHVNAFELLSFDARMRSLRGGVPAVFVGEEDARLAALLYGIVRDYRAVYRSREWSLITIECQGVI